MQVILKNAEDGLLKELKTAWEEQPNLRCIYFKHAHDSQDKNECDRIYREWLSPFLQILQDFMCDQHMRVFVCYDSDVFILARGISQKRLQEFLHHLEAKLGPASFAGLAYLFEVGVDWPRLRSLCELKVQGHKKLLEIKSKQSEKGTATVTDYTLALDKIDGKLIDSLPERRRLRRDALVMVVEDDQLSQRMISIALKDKYALAVVPDGQGAIYNYIRHAPDILFLDIGLPDLDGHDVLRRLFSIDPDAYVVMFSGNGNKENVLKAREQGAKGFIGKPFTQDKLLWYIERSPFIQAKLSKEHYHGHLVS